MKKKELLFILSILLLALLLWVFLTCFGAHSCDSIRITADGELLGVYSLKEDQVIPVGSSNVCEIQDGKIRMIHADCPDQLCIKQGAIGASGGMIVCLPNKIIIEGENSHSSDDSGADSVS